MKLGIFTTVTRPKERGDLYNEPLKCYSELADTVQVIDGIDTWDYEFDWTTIGKHFQIGYETCVADWVIHADLDMIFHERDYENIRQAIEQNKEAPALTFWKYQFIQPDRYNIKSRLVIAVNKKKFGDRIRFDGGGDLCQPTLDGETINVSQVPEARVPIYNYECLLKTKEQLMEDKGRFARAWYRTFNQRKLGYDDESAYEEWYKMVVGRNRKPNKQIELKEHPKVMHETLRNLKPEMWGYDGFGTYEKCRYVK